MADTYYAWSEIQVGEGDEAETKVKKVKAGEEVSASSLGIPDEEFDAMVEAGAVKTEEYPDLPEGYTGSPAQFAQEQAEAEGKIAEAELVLNPIDEADQESAAPKATQQKATAGKADEK
jgi:hypothetical protein